MNFNKALENAISKFDTSEFKKRIHDEDCTMTKYLPVLKEINKLGFLTLESQAGNHIKRRSSIDKKLHEIHEKAYIIGFMKEKDAIAFIRDISISTDKIAVHISVCNNNIDIPASLDIPLTITMIDGDVTIHTHMSFVIPEKINKQYRKSVLLNDKDKVVLIMCYDNKWNRTASKKNGLFTDVKKSLNK